MDLPDNAALRRRVFALGVLLVLGTVLSSLAAFANPPVDEWLYLQLREADLPAGLDVAEQARSAPVVVGVALLTLTAWRCRALVAAVAASLLVGIGLAVVLRLLVAAERPFDSAVGGTDSYPSPAVLLLSVLAVLVPVCLRVASRTARLATPATVLLWTLVALTGLQEVYAGLRLPLDVLGGVVVGAGTGVAAEILLQDRRLHRSCSGCPWQGTEAAGTEPPATVSREERRAHPLYRAAVLWSVGLAVVLTGLGLTRGIPRTPESGVMGTGLEVPLNIGLVVLVLVGVVLAGRWHVAGAVVVAVAAVLLAYASSVEYPPWVAILLAVAGFLPALLLWVQWHRGAGARAALTVATATAGLLGGLVFLAATNYSAEWGPTHPRSTTPAVDDSLVEWVWSGAVSDTGFTVRARTATDAQRVRLLVSETPTLAEPVPSAPVASESATENVVSLTVEGLAPGRDYYYALEVDGEVDTARLGHVATFPRGPASFTFAVSSCSRTGSSGMVFDAIRRTRPLFYVNDGDWYYGDIDRDDPDLYRGQYEANLTSPAQAALYAQVPTAYVWDDHDYDGNDGDRQAESRPAAMRVYREWVPHYPLRGGAGSPVFQAFTVGDVRVVLTDGRSARDPAGVSPRSMLGDVQRGWLVDELARADRFGLVVWVNAAPWVARADPTTDTWGGFAEERRTISDAIARHHVDNLLMVSGDAHMVAYDDGTHTDYSTSGNAGFPLFQAAALDRRGSIKGGPYSGPVIPGGGQFGTVHVDDDGRRVTVTVAGRTWQDEVLFRRTFTLPRESRR